MSVVGRLVLTSIAALAIASCADSQVTEVMVGPPASESTLPDRTTTSTTAATTTTTTTTTTVPTTTTTTLVPPDGLASSERRLQPVTSISGAIAPKSLGVSGTGLVFAQNMMYRHTVTVYDRDYQLVATISDTVRPTDFGHPEFDVELRGSPVEVAFTSDGAYAYVSNYKMYGGGLRTDAGDSCPPGNWPDSFVYRIDTVSLQIDQLIRVGPVPKFLAVTPDDRRLVVSNWCGYDVSIIDLTTGEEEARIPVGRFPRGVAISPDSGTAYVALMGSTRIATIDLGTFEVSYIEGVGRGPRDVLVSQDGTTLFVSLNGEGRLAKLDLATGQVVARVATGSGPRSMALSDDGTVLYVVNYHSNTFSKVRTEDMVELEEHPTGHHPIGIAYDPDTREVWVSPYGGPIQIWVDRAP
jgi:YVTN family beta-propeller protein